MYVSALEPDLDWEGRSGGQRGSAPVRTRHESNDNTS